MGPTPSSAAYGWRGPKRTSRRARRDGDEAVLSRRWSPTEGAFLAAKLVIGGGGWPFGLQADNTFSPSPFEWDEVREACGRETVWVPGRRSVQSAHGALWVVPYAPATQDPTRVKMGSHTHAGLRKCWPQTGKAKQVRAEELDVQSEAKSGGKDEGTLQMYSTELSRMEGGGGWAEGRQGVASCAAESRKGGAKVCPLY